MRFKNFGRRFALLALILAACGAQDAFAQTPSPIQEWQYDGGIV